VFKKVQVKNQFFTHGLLANGLTHAGETTELLVGHTESDNESQMSHSRSSAAKMVFIDVLSSVD